MRVKCHLEGLINKGSPKPSISCPPNNDGANKQSKTLELKLAQIKEDECDALLRVALEVSWMAVMEELAMGPLVAFSSVRLVVHSFRAAAWAWSLAAWASKAST